MNNKNAFVVLGPARSGTSAITRGLQALGVSLGDKLTPGNEKWNPKGFFEDNDIVYKINAKVFTTLGFAAYGIETLKHEEQMDAKLNTVRQAAISLLKERFAATHFWGFKDPSTVKLLAFWQSIFTEMNINDYYVIALRNPLAMAESYKKLTGCELEIGLLLWLMHVYPAIEETHNKKRVIVSYELLLRHPRMQLERMQKAFNLPPLSDSEIKSYENEFLDKNLQHFSHYPDEINTHPAMSVVPLCAEIYSLCMQMAQDEIDDAEFMQKWHAVKDELNKIYPVYGYIDKILKRNYQLERDIRSIKKSILWKMTSPLRIMENIFRGRKKKAREARRITKAYG